MQGRRLLSRKSIAIAVAVVLAVILIVWAGPYLFFSVACRLTYCDL